MPIPTMEQKFKRVAKVYRDTIDPLKKLLEAAIKHGFPEDHIHRIEHMILELEAIKELASDPDRKLFPVRKPGRPYADALKYEEHCHNHFTSVCPPFQPLKKRKEKGTDAAGVVKPQPGLIFDFKPKR